MSDRTIVLADKDLISVQQARQAVERAHKALQSLKQLEQAQIDLIVSAMAEAVRTKARRLAEMAVEETGYGKVEDKTTKNLFAAVDIFNFIKGLKTCGVISENRDKGVVEIAVPFGVIAAIIPTTNPTSTAIFKVLSAVKARNAVVVSPHPRAVACTVETARLMYEAGRRAGLPEDSITWLDQVTLEGATEVMRHRKTALILATGGPGMVRAAYSSGKPAYGVGPGNVPSFIERSADVPKAVRDVVAGKTFDWGVLCSSEQAIVCDAPIERQVLEELKKNGAHLLSPQETTLIEDLIQKPDGSFNTAIVGQAPQRLAEMAGFAVSSQTTCLVGRPQGVGKEHPLSREKLSPILAFFVEDGWEKSCERCIEILNFGGLGHTMSLHSKDEKIIMEFGLHKPAYRICVNTPSTHGSVGMTTGVPPSMTLGCGSPGGNITSDNITPLHLINIKRLAYEIRSIDQIRFDSPQVQASRPSRPESPATSPPFQKDAVRRVVESVVERYLEQKKKPERISPSSASRHEAAVIPPAPRPVDFVCEDDVRQAVKRGEKIAVDDSTIITPAARDAGEAQDVFDWLP